MADDLDDVGTVEFFPFTPNFVSSPNTNLSLLRDLKEYPGTTKEIGQVEEEIPIQCSCKFELDNMDDISSMFDFFHSKRGMAIKFWFRHPAQAFSIKEGIVNGNNTMVCYPNFSQFVYQGFERIYFELASGDLLARKVNGIVYDDVDDDITVSLNTTFDRDLTSDDIINIGRLILCRFDNDILRTNCASSQHLSFKLDFYELVREYSTI